MPTFPDHTPKDEHFDLYILERDKGILWSIDDLGITVKADRIAFSIGGVAHEGLFSDMREIKLHLQPIISKSDSGSVGWCRILFADGYVLSIISGNAHGLVSEEHNAAYLNFVAELHHRISAKDKQRMRFVAGVSEGRHMLLMVCAAIFGLMSLIPIYAFFYSGDWRTLPVLIATIGLAYPIWKNAEANRPRNYDPDNLPQDLVPEA